MFEITSCVKIKKKKQLSIKKKQTLIALKKTVVEGVRYGRVSSPLDNFLAVSLNNFIFLLLFHRQGKRNKIKKRTLAVEDRCSSKMRESSFFPFFFCFCFLTIAVVIYIYVAWFITVLGRGRLSHTLKKRDKYTGTHTHTQFINALSALAVHTPLFMATHAEMLRSLRGRSLDDVTVGWLRRQLRATSSSSTFSLLSETHGTRGCRAGDTGQAS